MASYLYRTYIVTDDTEWIGLSAGEKTQHATDTTDYETNHQASTVKITDITIAETTFVGDMDYTSFDSLIATPYDWTDVKEIDEGDHYDLYLITSNPL